MLRQENWGLKCEASQDRTLKLYLGARGRDKEFLGRKNMFLGVPLNSSRAQAKLSNLTIPVAVVYIF